MGLIKKKLLEMMPKLRRYSYGLTGSVDKGDELLQDSIVKILSINKDIKHIDNLNAYFYKIISNDWKDKIKKRKVETYDIEEFSNTLSANDLDLNEKIDSKRKNKKIHELINELSENLKSTFLLATIEEKSYKDISEILDIPLGTVMSRLNEARKKLKISISKDGLNEN
jgi:RNA polymerase sigma-70 factor (ECF subfamily)